MNSCELATSIFERATAQGKKAWLSEKQSAFMFTLLARDNAQYQSAIAVGYPVKYPICFDNGLELHRPPFYIRRNGFDSLYISKP